MLRRGLVRTGIIYVLAVASLAVAGCGEEQPGKSQPAREGLAIGVAGVDYNVFITRQLNVRDSEDRDYYAGSDPPSGSTYYGIFMQACNNGDKVRRAATSFRVVDSRGDEFDPRELPAENIFAYRGRELAPGECIPGKGSIAASAPTGGSLLLFELPLEATESRPLELEILGPFDLLAGEREVARIELDI